MIDIIESLSLKQDITQKLQCYIIQECHRADKAGTQSALRQLMILLITLSTMIRCCGR